MFNRKALAVAALLFLAACGSAGTTIPTAPVPTPSPTPKPTACPTSVVITLTPGGTNTGTLCATVPIND